jgi:hypothetical protein
VEAKHKSAERIMVIMGNAMRKLLFVAFLIAIMVYGLALAGTLRFSIVRAATEVTGIISSDTTWTTANSPYNLSSSITVASGATLTIESGTIVQLNEYSLQINGALIARGTSNDPINFHGGTPISTGGWAITTEDNDYSIVFSPSSTNWSQQTQSGCIIENAVIGNLVINGGSPKISNSFLGNIDIWGGTPEIFNNNVVGGIGVYAGSALIANNTVSQQNHYFLGVNGAIVAQRYDRNNNIIVITRKATPFVSGNVIIGNISQVAQGIGFETENATITNNTIYGCYGAGIGFYEGTGNALISDNTIYYCSYGINLNETGRLYGDHNAVTTIQRNLIYNNAWGIVSTLPVTVENNTIENNTVGIATSAPLSVTYNNIEGNNQSVYLSSPNNLNATNNWWGTTDTQAISQSIHDFDDDSTLGKVTFVPFLTEPNPATSGQSVTPTPTPKPSQEPTLTPETATIIGFAIIVTVFAAGAGLLIYLVKRK